jgi:glycine/D-amino acid oxidase-like deaminating enzyme
VHAALRDVEFRSFWLDSTAAPALAAPLTGHVECDLAVVGGGYTGLWTALLAKERDPSRDVLLLESESVGWAASGRNGGFCSSSLTHGIGNGMARFPDEMDALESLGRANLDALAATVDKYGIDCDFTRAGSVNVALAPYQLDGLAEEQRQAARFGHETVLLDRDAMRAEVASPTYLGGLWHKDTVALLDPARLAWGLREACERLGVRIAERSAVRSIARDGAGVRLGLDAASVRAGRVALATNAFPSLLRRVRPYTVPVWDYVLMTEPLTGAQLDSVGWRNRQGLDDGGNQFHYYRLSRDNRILWGGYDAIYHWRNGLDESLVRRPATFELLARQFFQTFPQLDGLRFSHAWGGAIDTSTRFFAFQRTAMSGRVGYSVGYTGLGVGATRFGAELMLDLLDGRRNEAAGLRAMRSRPVPFPPEPLRWSGIQLTRHYLAKADESDGRRGLWLRALDRLGLGFNS